MVHRLGLVDLGLVGGIIGTWVKLDKGLGNLAWKTLFS